jgi:hypothetical protein
MLYYPLGAIIAYEVKRRLSMGEYLRLIKKKANKKDQRTGPSATRSLSDMG